MIARGSSLFSKTSAISTTTMRRCILSRQAVTASHLGRFFSSSIQPQQSPKMVGFVGLGQMGLPMAQNLAKHSQIYKVVAFDPNPTACDQARQSGIDIVNSVEQVATTVLVQPKASTNNNSNDRNGRAGDTLIAMLPDDRIVDAVLSTWQDEIVTISSHDAASNPIYIVNGSTVSPSTSRKWEEAFRELNVVMVDAPVSGGMAGARKGTLTFMAGCASAAHLDQVQPYLDIMGARTVHCGPPGTGSATKLCNNLALAAQMVGVCEALNLGEKLGVDPVVLASVMNSSTAKCWSSEVNNPHPAVAQTMESQPPATRDYAGGFATNLMLKDLKLALKAAAEEQDLALPVTSTTKDLYHLAQLHGLGNKDFGVLLEFLRGAHNQ